MKKEIAELRERMHQDIQRVGGVEEFNNYSVAHEVITNWINNLMVILERMEEK